MEISRRAGQTPASPIRKLHQSAEAAKTKGTHVYHLNIGQPDLAAPSDFFDAVKSFSGSHVAYAPSAGFPEVIRAWQAYYRQHGIGFAESEIIVTTGASEAILFALMAIADCGDEAIVFEPLYTNYITFAAMVDVRLAPVALSPRQNFHLPPVIDVSKHITDKTKAIIICNPSNPTGTVYTKAELQRVADLAAEHNLFIIADETYREIVFGDKPFVSMMDFPEIQDRVIIVDSVSKRFNLCGARVGIIASHYEGVMAAALKFAQGRLSSPTLDQLGVIPLLEQSEKYTARLKHIYEERMRTVTTGLSNISGVHYANPEGAFYTLARLPVQDAEHFSRWLLEEFDGHGETVMFAPGEGFYVTPGLGKQEVRIAYVLDSERLERAMAITKQALSHYQKKYD